MSLDFEENEVEDSEEIVEKRRNCPQCGELGTVEKKADYIYVNATLNLRLNIPAHVCTSCDGVVYEPADFKTLLEAEESAQGRPYVRVEIKGGRVRKYSLH